jgi:hypothetical protein
MNTAVLLEATTVGIMTILIGYISYYIINEIYPIDFLPEICKKWNKNYTMEKSLFLTGFLLHILCEYTGLNKWYCKNGNSCK